jgi:hypothetical protein
MRRLRTIRPESCDDPTYDADDHGVILNHTRKLKAGATYTATVTSGPKDEAGNVVVAKSWSFKVRG